ncbi:hypothetical protein NKG94_16080 [Micromonospora sp. M12]
MTLAFTTDAARSWPLYALTAPLCAPGLCAAFAVMSAYSAGDTGGVLRTYRRAWRATARPAMLWTAAAMTALVVLAVDARAAWGHRVGALALPVLATLIVLTVATTLLGLVTLADRPTARLREVARTCVYLAVRRWYLTAVSLLVLVLLAQLLAARPRSRSASPPRRCSTSSGPTVVSPCAPPSTHRRPYPSASDHHVPASEPGRRRHTCPAPDRTHEGEQHP